MVCPVQLVVGAILKSGSEIIDVDTEANRENATHNCWIGAAIYAGFFVVSVGCYFAPQCGSRKDTTDNRQRLMAIRQEE